MGPPVKKYGEWSGYSHDGNASTSQPATAPPMMTPPSMPPPMMMPPSDPPPMMMPMPGGSTWAMPSMPGMGSDGAAPMAAPMDRLASALSGNFVPGTAPSASFMPG